MNITGNCVISKRKWFPQVMNICERFKKYFSLMPEGAKILYYKNAQNFIFEIKYCMSRHYVLYTYITKTEYFKNSCAVNNGVQNYMYIRYHLSLSF